MSASHVWALRRILKITPQSPTFTTQQNSSLPDRLGVVITLNLWATHLFLAYAAKSITSRPVKNKTTPVFPIVLNLFFKQNKGIYTHTARHDAIVTTTHGGLVGGIRGMSFIFVCYHSHEWILPLREVQPCGGGQIPKYPLTILFTIHFPWMNPHRNTTGSYQTSRTVRRASTSVPTKMRYRVFEKQEWRGGKEAHNNQ